MAPIALPSISVRKYHYTFRNISQDGKYQFRITRLVISFGLSQLNIANYLSYTISLLNISYYQPIRSSVFQVAIFLHPVVDISDTVRKRAAVITQCCCNRHVYRVVVYKKPTSSELNEGAQNKAEIITNFTFK